ncbi:MAG: TolC family protein [Rhodothermales bacterium]|nr:TolC family protein [Rhodothermales bacterium]
MNRLKSTCLVATSLVFVFILSAAGPVQAQDAQTITFNQAVELALSRNVSIQRAENNLDLQSLRVKSARADFLPNLNLSTGVNRNYGLFIDNTTFQQRTTVTDNMSVSASSGVTLFDGFGNISSLRAANSTLESQEHIFERTQQQVVFDVIQNYLNVILAEENIQIQQENVDAQTRQLEQIQEFVNVGTRPVSDLYQQQAAQASAESQLLTAENNFQIAQTQLIQVLQIDPLGDYHFVAPDLENVSLTIQEYNPEVLLRGAFDKRSDLRAQEAGIRAARYGVLSARSGYLPSLSLSGSFSTGWSSSRSDVFSFSDQLDNNRSERVGLSLSIPIFNRLNTMTSVESAQVQYRNAELDLENLQQTVAIEVRQAYLNYLTAVKRLDVTEKQLRAAQQALNVEEERYDVGASTLVELTQARANYVDAASQRAQAVFQFYFQQRLIDYYQGTLDPSQPLFE